MRLWWISNRIVAMLMFLIVAVMTGNAVLHELLLSLCLHIFLLYRRCAGNL